MKRHNFKKLQIWIESMELIDENYLFTNTLPDFEKFGLQSQMNRCAVSIASNIAEGTSKHTNKHFIKFLEDTSYRRDLISNLESVNSQLSIGERTSSKVAKEVLLAANS